MKDFYYILGADRDSTPAELDAAYRKLAQKLQPAGQEQDHFLDGHFQEITEAYIVLSNPTKRKKYDAAFKKNDQRRLYYFKIRYLNVIAMLALVGFTALFGYYVINSIKKNKEKKLVMAASPAPTPPKRHKKKLKTALLTKAKSTKTIAQPSALDKTLAKPLPVKIFQQGPVGPAPVKKEHVQQVVVGQVAVQREEMQQIPVQKPAPARQAETETTYTSELLANVTGLVYLHQTANYRSPVLASIPSHAKVHVLERGNSFYKIMFQNQTGYVPKWTVATP